MREDEILAATYNAAEDRIVLYQKHNLEHVFLHEATHAAIHGATDTSTYRGLFDAMNPLCKDGVDADEMPNGKGEFGLVRTNPIPTKTVVGSIAYLNGLRGLDGAKIEYKRLGSMQSAVSTQLIDVYDVKIPTDRKLVTLYISPYERRNSKKAPRGFILVSSWAS